MCTSVCNRHWLGMRLPQENYSEAQEASSLMFHREGIPSSMVMNGSKEQMIGKSMG